MAAKPHTANPRFSIEAHERVTVASWEDQSEVNALLPATPGRGTEAIRDQCRAFVETEGTRLLFSWCFLTRAQDSPHTCSWTCSRTKHEFPTKQVMSLRKFLIRLVHATSQDFIGALVLSTQWTRGTGHLSQSTVPTNAGHLGSALTGCHQQQHLCYVQSSTLLGK